MRMMFMGKAIVVAFAIMFTCALQVWVLPAVAQLSCGLQSGKYANYNWSVGYSGMGVSYSMSGTIGIDVQSVSGTSYMGTATFKVTGGSFPSSLLNITQTPQTFSGDVASGTGSAGPMGVFMGVLAIPANMTADSNIPGVGSVEQVSSWGGRSAVVVNSTMSSLGVGEGSTYYDEATGILLRSTSTMSYQGIYSMNFNVQLSGTDLWSGFGGGLDAWVWIVIIVVIVVVVVAGAIMAFRRRHPAAPVTSTPLPPPPPPPLPS